LKLGLHIISFIQGSIGQIHDWAEANCGANNCPGQSIPDDNCFNNPFDDIDVPILSVDHYNDWVEVNHPGDLSNLEGCEDLLKSESQWFDPAIYGDDMTCNFNIQLTYPDDGSSKPPQMSQTVLFYDSETPEDECVGEGMSSTKRLHDFIRFNCFAPGHSPVISI